MSDLLGSILNSMQKPPSVSAASKEKLLEKKQQEKLKKIQEEEKAKLRNFRKNIEEKVDKFLQADSPKLEFETMDKVLRSIVHDVAEIAGLPAFSLGFEDVDRHVVVYKKETLPSEDELAALRKGEEYDPEKAKLKRELESQEEMEEQRKRRKGEVIPTANYRDKYKHLIGEDAGKTAAQVTKPNKQFGFVPSANKQDQRSIEQTLADIREKKKQKASESVQTAVDEQNSN
ncbi:Sperm-associated antigen 7-like protein [Leptotrombidium deliense]|uniref:Sperm-associated antigen 7-like protein n=1 Tax=Leptotrombidium deliense TaxID=299467 RepID=A0A443SDJ2_9ACAR|nr:Sperm-associated antigen 7-like protein [Leptotrombidium deliense]